MKLTNAIFLIKNKISQGLYIGQIIFFMNYLVCFEEKNPKSKKYIQFLKSFEVNVRSMVKKLRWKL